MFALLYLAAAAALFMLASPVFAEPLCEARSAAVKYLADKYGETPVGQGLTNPNSLLVELFASKNGETWTLLVSYPNGTSCVIAAGKDWRKTMPKLLKPMGLPI